MDSAIFKELKKFSNVMDFNPPVSEDEIKNFEIENGISLPASYKELLKHFDGGEIFVPGTLIFGINNYEDCPSIKEVNSKSKRSLISIPNDNLIIAELNFGDFIAIDLNTEEVIQWDHECDEEFDKWDTLYDFIEFLITSYEAGESQ